ncbi:MAG: aminopeptidase, partial [Clostridia bacterium]|nr:aminopeptidase [Clostridia bacterium]
MANETKKTTAAELSEKLMYKAANAFEKCSEKEIEAAYAYCEDYKKYLDNGKTERECVKAGIALLEDAGFKPYSFGTKTKKGGKYYYNNHGKSLVAFVIGSESLDKGVYISAAHIDSPRTDLKQHPVYEADGMCYLKTHYYGGIKKYQWTTIPLALHGVVTKSNGETIDFCVGEDENDPIFYIDDLLPHLAGDQMRRSLADGITGEQLNILVGSRPYAEKTSEAVKLNIL